MTTSRDLRELAVQGLLAAGATAAGANVFSPRTWSTWNSSYPVLLVQTPEEEGESWGRNGAPAFTVTTTLRITARAQAAAAINDAGAVVVEEQLETMREQIKVALVNYPPLMRLLQQYPFFRSHLDVPKEGTRPIGELVLDIGLEFVQGPEEFYQATGTPLQGIEVTVREPPGTVEPYFTIDFPPFIS